VTELATRPLNRLDVDVPDDDLGRRLAPLTAFMGAAPLTEAIARLENALGSSNAEEVTTRLSEQGVTSDLLRAAFAARAEFGRINDLIHATAIALTLPRILHPGERMKRPSLAAGNDPSRPFDVETDQRIAEFKLSRWDGHDAGRKRQLFKDLVHLAAADANGRAAELYVLGERPIRFLSETRSSASWALNRMADNTKDIFEEHFGTTDISIPNFVAGPGAHVRIINLEVLLPEYFPHAV